MAGLKVVLLAAAAALALLGAASAPAMLGVMPALAASAYRVPDLVLARRARSRQASIELRVPDLVEVLVAATEAGLAPAIAFERASEVLRGPIGEELRRAVGVECLCIHDGRAGEGGPT